MELTWTVFHIAPTEGDDPSFVPYAYTAGLPSTQGRPNIWMSYVGACGHVLGQGMAHFLMNEAARRLIDGTLVVGGSFDAETAAGAVIRVAVGPAISAEAADRLEVWPHDGGPVLPLSWTCSLDTDWLP